jgi:hypothetical protein
MRLNVQNQRCAHLEMKRVEIITKVQIAFFFFLHLVDASLITGSVRFVINS